MTKALVTGARGFVGKHLVRKLKESDTEVFSLTSSANVCDSNDWIFADIRDAQAIKNQISTLKPDEIYHLAAISKPTGDDYREYFDTNLYGTLNILDAARECNCSVIVVGSAYSYGNYAETIDESFSLNPLNVYGASKAASDILASTYSRDIKVVRTRPFNHTGAGQDNTYLVPGIIERMLSAQGTDKKISIGDITPVRDFLDVRDVAAAYVKLMRETCESDVYNICSGKGLSVEQVYESVKSQLGFFDLRYETDESLLRPADIQNLVGNPGKLVRDTSWKPEIDFSETVKQIVHALET